VSRASGGAERGCFFFAAFFRAGAFRFATVFPFARFARPDARFFAGFRSVKKSARGVIVGS
jgi:hypothetical protein